MSNDQSYPFPQMLAVDGGQFQHHQHHGSDLLPGLVPCWSFPPARERPRGRRAGGGYAGAIPGLAMVMLLLFVLVFAALGFGGYQIHKMQTEMRDMRKVSRQAKTLQEPSRAEKLIGVGAEGAGKREERKESEEKAAAHMLGRVEKVAFRNTLRWDPRVGHAFTAGGVAYQVEDGALRVNRSGLYHVYSRVELIFRRCSPTSSFVHTVFVMRTGHPLRPLTLMEAHRAGFCSRAAEQAWTADSYLGSAVRLEERDRVLVNVSHPQHLSHSHDGNFFGLYQI
ncbi:tumor necrosis factor ligand superfamily member 6 isoform X2 [Entelurus aequoreus]|uniref:tumor necrosis factor ligand superfamily member 6 isoform X2 n=1 Tax=Entelurus aequoreus TaxID=161455 RepID=UPI002B1D28B6|nr:tumor necrosis factor ligand superfamily member 6 isoform X2 [Entelurus aequoreus]